MPRIEPPHEPVAIPHEDDELVGGAGHLSARDEARLSRAALVSFVCGLAPFFVIAASISTHGIHSGLRLHGARDAASWVLFAMFTVAPLVALGLGASTSRRLGRIRVSERPRGRALSVAACALAVLWIALLMLAT